MTEQTLNPHNSQSESSEVGVLSLHDIIQMVLANWYWFALSVAVCLSVAYLYVARTPKVYSRKATILVKDDRKGANMDISAFSDLSGFQPRSSVDNEVFILQSRRLMQEVVRNLNLTTNYTKRHGLRTQDLYGCSPIEADFVDDSENQAFSFKVRLLPGGERVELTEFNDGYIAEEESERLVEASYGDTVSTPLGRMIIRKTLYMSPADEGTVIRVGKTTLGAATSAYRADVQCAVENKQTSVVGISMSNTVPKRAEDVINTLITEYNDDAIADKRRISEETAAFIRSRLEIIGQELGDVDRDIEDFKKSNRMVDLGTEAARNVEESSRFKAEGLSIDNQINVAEFIRSYLFDKKHAGDLIPAMAAISNPGISEQIATYNEGILRREKLSENSSANNPVIQELDNNLAAVRRSIIASLDSHISALEIQRKALRTEEEQANRRISTVPSQEKEMLGITRQQKIKEELYLYLLNKQEETQLNLAVAESNARIIDLAYGPAAPVAPKTSMIFAIALLAGVAIPFGLIFLLSMLDTTIRGRRDVEENLSAPFLGDIPLYEGRTTKGVAVREAGRDAVSEAFRMLRSNMTFMNVSSKGRMQCVLFTSSNPHAGKTFVAINLATTLAAAGKKVVLLDLDLRRHALSSEMGQRHEVKGITAYLSGEIDDIGKLISNPGINENLDVIYAGIQPPNPAEMLLSERLDALVAELRTRYEYIFIDSTPAMSVADAISTDRLCDLCIYIVREGVLDRRQLPDIERLYLEKKFHNMCIVLNGARTRRHGYGYSYGYGYTYGYGYGDDYQEPSYRKQILNLLRKLFPRREEEHGRHGKNKR